MSGELRFAPLEPDPILFDSAQTGDFAAELAEMARQEQVPPWCCWIAWQGSRPIAMGGFKSSPDAAGSVEIGYLTFAVNQGRGHATAVASFVVSKAFDEGALEVLAHTLQQPSASTRVLEKNGFVRDGFGEDDDVGEVWRWRICK